MIMDWSKYPFKKDEVVLFDTNVWMKLFPRVSNPKHTNQYADLLSITIATKTRIALDVLVLAEFVNAFCRKEYRRYQELCKSDGKHADDYKQFRKGDLFNVVARDLSVIVKQILNLPNLLTVDHNFSKINIKSLASLLVSRDMDWNDRMLVEACKCNSWSLVSDDGDYLNAGITVLTGNQTLLLNARKYKPPIILKV